MPGRNSTAKPPPSVHARWPVGQAFPQLCQALDARYHLPRPATAQHWPAYQAVLHLLGLAGQTLLTLAAGALAAWLFVCSAVWLELHPDGEFAAHLLGVLTVLVAGLEAAQGWLVYAPHQQTVTHGSARWADLRTLRALRLAWPKGAALPPFTLLLGSLGRQADLVLGPEHSTCHLALFGPPGAGKSATFFIAWQRAWAAHGSVIVLDPKGELYDQTAHLFRQVYRVDLQTPARSDRWNFLPACKANAEYAHKVAALLLDSEQSRRSSADPFWREAEKAALTAILLQLNQLHERPAPHMILELIAQLSLTQLNELMLHSTDPQVPLYWGMFSKVEPKLQAGVLIGLGVACADFNTPHLRALTSPITQPLAARGVRWVDFRQLRQPGTAIFLVVAEGDAERYKRVLATFFGLANDCLRNEPLTDAAAPVLFNLDEIGNIYLPDLPAALGVGRGRRLTYALGYQNIAQLYHQYGTDGGDAVLGSVGALVFLPGLDQRTAEYAARRLGTTTVLQASTNDVREGTKLDAERWAETGRPLLDASEIRQLPKYQQALAIISNAPPVRLSYPPLARVNQPPLAAREVRFQAAGALPLALEAVLPTPVLTHTSTANVISAASRTPPPPAHSTDAAPPAHSTDAAPPANPTHWAQAHALTTSAPSPATALPLPACEPEYDPAALNEAASPLFDFGERGGR
jgi:type IV secretory pathway TraG/TraD family ATPase VirD4